MYLIKKEAVQLEKSALFSSVEFRLDEVTNFTGFVRSSDDRTWLYVHNCLFIYEKTGVLWREYHFHKGIREIHILKDGKAFVFTEGLIYTVDATDKQISSFLILTRAVRKWVVMQNGNLVLLLSDGRFWVYDVNLRFLHNSIFVLPDANNVIYLGERFSDNLVYYVENVEIGSKPHTKRVLNHRVWDIDANKSRRVYRSNVVQNSYCKVVRRLNDRFLLTVIYQPFRGCYGLVYDLEERKEHPISYDFGFNFQVNTASFHWVDELNALLFVKNRCMCSFYNTTSGESLGCCQMGGHLSQYHVDTERKDVLVLDRHLLLTNHDICTGFVIFISLFYFKR